MGVLGAPTTLDPYAPDAADLTWTLAAPLWRSLFRLAPDGSAVPDLAASLDVEGDRATVRLSPARWSSGAPITARDVVSSVARARPPSGLAGLDAVALDQATVRLSGFEGDWDLRLGRGSFVLPGGEAEVETTSGPFVLSAVTAGLKLRYGRNAAAAEPAVLERLDIFFVEQLATLVELLEDDRIDVAVLPSAVNIEERVDVPDAELLGDLGWETVRLDFPGLTPAQARTVAAALDRDRLEEVFIRSDGRVSDTLHPQPGAGGAAGPWTDSLRAGAAAPPVGVAAAAGDELIQLLQRAVVEQLRRAGLAADEIDAPPREIDRAGAAASVELVRRAGAPGLTGELGGPRRPRSLPLFQVETYLAASRELVGPAVNPTLAGPLWNAGAWGFAP
ncbi:MAG: ABC transporter substrate-binding protein [Actinomycetota bacterium]